jgi:3-phosphoshikimate 1-carboxyvinyltransferase
VKPIGCYCYKLPNITLENTSNSDDSEVMSKALANHNTIHNSQLIDIHHAGTAMRFLTAYFAVSEGGSNFDGFSTNARTSYQSIGRGSRTIGAKITYEVGYPPIRIIGQKITKSKHSCKCE